jgi:CRP/FNR family transcriptional regulator
MNERRLEVAMIKFEASARPVRRWEELLTDSALGAVRLEFAEGGMIYESLAGVRRLYLIHSGQVRTYEGGPNGSSRLLEILGAGDWFGEEALADCDDQITAHAIAESETVLSAIPAERLMDLLASHPAASAELIRQLATRLRCAREETNRFVFDDCSSRLVKTLLRFSGTAAATPQDNGTILLRITHRQLAEAVGAARETVSLALTQLRQQNLLRTGRNRLMFKPEALRTFSGNGNGAVKAEPTPV